MSAAMVLDSALARAAERPAPRVSFEFFPPKTPELEEKLWAAIARLASLQPAFVSVTYGAGGSTRDRTHKTLARMLRETPLKPAAHLTCVGSPRAELEGILTQYWETGVRHIVALRGDMPGGPGTPYEPHPDGCANAIELTAFAKGIADFEVSVAVYPERHPDSPDWEHEIDNFKRKLDAGAVRGISQFFYDADIFLRFRDRLAAAGVCAPVIPGVMPVTNVAGLLKMAGSCGATVPVWLQRMCDGLDDDPQTRSLVAAALAAELCARLNAEGIDDFHFYTLNRAEMTVALCRMLGVKEAQAPREATI